MKNLHAFEKHEKHAFEKHEVIARKHGVIARKRGLYIPLLKFFTVHLSEKITQITTPLEMFSSFWYLEKVILLDI